MRHGRFMCWLLAGIVLFFNLGIVAEGASGSGRNASNQGIVQLVSGKEREKVVSVVLDNSSSMVRKDEKPRDYITRWIEADYTVKALAAMMDAGDILRLYIMSGYREDKETGKYAAPLEVVIEETKDNAVEKVSEYLEDMRFSKYTYYQGVTRAAEDMKGDLKDKDCWIVILTDGQFYEPKKMDRKMLTEELHFVTQSEAYGGHIRVAYIPIGDGAISVEEDTRNGIYVADDGAAEGQDGVILKKVTDTINRIYGRVRLKQGIGERYLSQDQKEVRFRFDIPLERLIVFMQQSGKEEDFQVYHRRQDSEEEDGAAESGARISIGIPRVPTLLTKADEAVFEGRKTLPGYEDGEPHPVRDYDPELAKYKELWGNMLSYKKSSVWQGRFESQELVIPVNSEEKPDVEIYYQPAVKVGLEYIQNGESVRHIDGCLGSAVEEGHEEYCLREGALTVRIRLLDDNGNELPNVDSGLLYKDRFSVELVALEDGTTQQMSPTGTDYEFSGVLEQRDYRIVVTTPWDKQESGEIRVQERRKALEIEMGDMDGIWLNDSEDGANLLEVRVREDGMVPPSEILGQMTVNCSCAGEELIMVEVESEEPGLWLFRPVLADPSEHIAPKEAEITVSASRLYFGGEYETAEATVVFPVASHPEGLSVSLKSEEAIRV